MVQGDIKPYNFLIDPKTLQVTIIDFGCISTLPHSFVSFTLHSTRDKFITGIAESLGWKMTDNFSALGAAAGIYAQSAGRRWGKPYLFLVLDFWLTTAIGLDKDGLPDQNA